MMDPAALRHLPAFLAVAEHRNFTRAANDLGVSPSALSQSVRALEDLVGVPLLARTTRSVSVTDAGKRLLEEAGPGIRQARAALEAASLPSGAITGSLRLNVPGIAIQPVVAPLLERFTATHPGVSVQVIVENRLVDIVAERFDAGIRLEETVDRDMIAVRLSKSFRFVVVGSPSYLAARGRPSHPKDLSTHSLIAYRSPTRGTVIPWDLERRGKTFLVPTQGAISTNHDGMLIEAALRGMGLSYVSETSAAEHLAEGRLELVLEDWAPRVPGFFLYFPSRSQRSPPLRALVECARELRSEASDKKA